MLAVLLVLLFAGVRNAAAAGGDIVWQRGDSQAGKQQAVASAVDSQGNVIVTGYRTAASDDFQTVKFNADGSGIAWRATYDRTGGIDQALAVAVDSNDDVIVTGYSWNGQNSDVNTIKYNGATGAVIWQKAYNGAANGQDHGTAVGIDSLNNVYVGGYSQNGSGNDDYLILKYEPAEGALAWEATADGGGIDQVAGLAVGQDGIAITGQSWSGTAFEYLTQKYGFDGGKLWERRYASGGAKGKVVGMDGGGNVFVSGNINTSGTIRVYTAKYSGADGSIVWERTLNGGFGDDVNALAVGSAGNVYITGYTTTLTGNGDFYTARYAGADGQILWQHTFDSGGGNTDIATALAVDPAGDVFVTGYSASGGNFDFRTIKYKRDTGTLLWSVNFNGAANKNERAVGVGLAPSGDVLVAGWTDTASDDLDFYGIKYDAGSLDPPTGLTGTTLSSTSIRLDWTVNSATEEGFKIERKLGEDGTYAQIATVGPGTATYTDTGLVANNAYYYRVRAYSAASGDSHYSNEIHALTVYVTYAAPAWSYLYNNPDNRDDVAHAIATGADGHPVVTGFSERLVGSNNYQTIKLNKADKSVLWSDFYDDPDGGFDVAKCIAAGSGGAMFVSGSANIFSVPAQDNINSIFTLKYPVSGPDATWTTKYNGPGNMDDRSVASIVDAAGNLVVAGYGRVGVNNNDILLAKFNGADGSRIWAATPFEGGGEDFPTAVAIAADGSIYITGYSERTPGSGLYDMFTARFNGATGALVWSERYSATAGGNNRGNGIAVDAAGNIYVAGFATNGAGNRDLHTVKYLGGSASANRLWTRSVDGAAHGDDEAVAVKVDGVDGAIVVAGTVLTGAGDRDVSVIRYSVAGDTVWHKTLQRHDVDDEAVAMAMDASGYIYVAGTTANGVTTDILSLLYDYQGTLLDGTTFNGAANNFDEASSIAVNGAGEAFIAGYSTNAAGNYDLAVIKHVNTYLQMPSPFAAAPQVDYRKVNLSWTNNSSGTGLRIERTFGPVTGDSVWTPIYTAAPGTVAYQDTGLNANTNYCFRIEAYNGTLVSRNNVVCTTTSLAPPVLLTVSAVSTSALDVTWENVTGNTGYKVERKATAGGTWAQVGSILPADATVFHDTGLSNNIAYYYRVSAVNSVGYSLASNEKYAVTLPPAPSLNGPTGITASQMTLSWSSVAGNTGYKLERSPDNATWTQIATPAAGATSHPDTGLASGTTYYYRLRTVNASGDSDYSTVRSGKTLLNAPVASSAAAVSTSQLEITWTDTNGGGSVNESGVTIEYAACTNSTPATCADVNAAYWGGWTTATAGADATSFTIGSLTAGRTYRVRIMATLSSANSVYSNVISGTTTAITQPVLNALSVLSTSAIDLSWGDVDGEGGYKVERKTGAGSYAQVGANLAADTVVFHDTGLNAGTTYYYRVSVLNSVGTSNEQSAITLPAAPTLAVLTGVTTSQISLSWGSVTGNAGYRVERSTDNATWQQVATPAQGATGYTDTGLLSGMLYYYRVKTVNASGDSAASGVQSATTKLQTPVISSATAASNTQITLIWTDPNGTGNGNETGFTIEYAACTNSTPATCSDVNAAYWAGWSSTTASADSTTTTIGSLIGGRTYRFRVTATLTGANSGTSTVLGATTTAFVQPVLAAPAVLSTTAIDLSWNDVAGNTGYKVERKTGAGSFSQVGSNLAAGTVIYHDTGLTAGTTYTYRVSILNSVSGTSNEQAAITLSAAPSLNALSGITPSQIDLSWATVTGNAGYKIERSTDNATWTQVATPAQGATAYPDTGVVSGTTYYYRMRTTNASGDSAYSTTQSGTTKLQTPVLSSATAASNTQITLVWTDPNGTGNGNETGVTIEYAACTNSTPATCSDVNAAYWAGWSSTTASADSTTTTIGSLIGGRTYRFRVTATLAGANSGTSTVLGATTTAFVQPVLAAPTVLSTTAIDLSWNDVAGNTGYKVERKTGAGSFSQVGSDLAAGTVVYHDTGLTAGTTYTYRVSILNSVSGSSNEQSAITLSAAPALNALSGITPSQIDLSWASVTGNAGYKIERSTDNATWTQVATPAQGATGYSDTGVVSGTTYYYRMRTTNASGDSAYSTTRSGTTKLVAPTLSSATAASISQIALVWTDPNGTGSGNETGVTIEYAGCTNSTPATCSDVNAAYWGAWSSTTAAANSTTTTISGLTAGRTYRFRVTANLAGADSAASNVLAGTTTAITPPVLNALTVLSTSAIDLSWGNVEGNSGYKVERKIGAGGTYAQVGSNLAADTVVFHDTGLSAGTVYYYRVSVLNAVGYSNEQNAITLSAAPVLSALSGVTTSQIVLSWASVTGNAGYKVERSTDNATWGEIATPAQGATGYTNTGLVSGRLYYYRVKTTNASGDSVVSNVQSATTKLQTPVLNSAAASSTTQIALGWTDPNGTGNGNETGLTIEYAACTNGDPVSCSDVNGAYWGGWSSTSSAADSTSATIGSLTAGRTYRIRVTATLSGADSAPGTALAATTNLVAPSNLAVSVIDSSSVSLSWTDVLGETNYKVEQDGTLLAGVTLAKNSASHTVSGLSMNIAYCFRVQPYNGTSSAFSNQQCITIYGPPSLNSATVDSQTQITLGWTDVGSETGYEVWRATPVSQSNIAGAWNAYVNLTGTPLAADTVSYANAGLTAGYTYKYKVRYKLPDTTFSAWSNELQATTVPPTPAGAAASVTSTTAISVTWTDGVGETGYTVEHKPLAAATCAAEDWTGSTSASLAANAASHPVTGLAMGATYCFRVKASNSAGSSPWTAAMTQVTWLPAPTLNALSGVTPIKIDLSWSNVTGNTGYKIERSLNNSTWNQLATPAADAVSHSDTTVTPNQIYYYRISAKNSAGVYSATSTVQSATTPAYAAPVLTLSGMTTTQITLTWTDVFNTGYKIERSLNNSTWTQIATPAQGSVTYNDTGLSLNTLYYYRISTRTNTGTYTSPSAVKSGTTAPAAPSPVTLAVVSESRIDLSWQVVSGATNYKVLRSVGADGPWAQVANPSVPYTTLYCGYTTPSIGCPTLQPVTTSYSDTGLTANTTYCYQVKSSNAAGSDSTASATVCGKTSSVGGPVLSSLSAVNSMGVRVEWTYDPSSCTPVPCGAPDAFEIEMRLWNGEWARKGRVTGGTFSFVDSKFIEPEKSYTYRVRARAGTDASPYSNTRSITTPTYVVSPPACP